MRELFYLGEWLVHPDDGTLARDSEKRQLDPKAVEVVLYLAEHPGKVISRERLIQAVWGDTSVTDGSLTHAISDLRKALEDDPENPRYIETLPRRGYRLISGVVLPRKDLENRRVSEVQSFELSHKNPIPDRGEFKRGKERNSGVIIPGLGTQAKNRNLALVEQKIPVEDSSQNPEILQEHQPPQAEIRLTGDSHNMQKDKGWTGRRTWLGTGVIVLIFAAFLLFLSSEWVDHSDSVDRIQNLQAVPLTTYPGSEFRPDFSQHGDRFVFMWTGPDRKNPNPDIWVQQIGPGSPLRLTAFAGADFCPYWSPDDQLVAFARMLPDRIAVMTVPALGGAERKIVEVGRNQKGATGLTGISWTPDGTCLILSFRPSGQEQAQIFLFPISTGDLKALTFPPEGTLGDYYGEISPDGKKIAFFRGESILNWDLYVQFLSDDQPRRLTFENFDVGRGVSWLPNSQEVIFSAGSQFHNRLWRIDISESNPRLLMGFGERVNLAFPSVSPSGDLFAYTESITNKNNVWRSFNPRKHDISESPQCLIDSSLFDWGAVPSPDGEKIVFGSNRSAFMEIYVCNKDGSQQKPITNLEAYCGAPSWSPDGRLIAFDGRIEDFNIYVVSAEGSNLLQLTDHPLADVTPSWSRDGDWIYFSSRRSGKYQIWKIPADGGEAIQVTRQGGFYAHESADGYLYYTIDEKGEIWKTPVGGGEETPVLQQSLYFANWALASDGIYFFGDDEAKKDVINFFDFENGEIQTVSDPTVGPLRESLKLTPDEQWFIFSTYDIIETDLILVKNFQ